MIADNPWLDALVRMGIIALAMPLSVIILTYVERKVIGRLQMRLGPMLRATGLAHDLRRAEPYSIYDRFEFDIPTGTQGDVYDRYLVRLGEMRQSVRIVEQALERMPEGAIMAEGLKRTLRLPEGEVYMRNESPRGEYGIYLVSRGADKPYRLKIRSPAFSNLSALRAMSIGSYVADTIINLGSIDIVLCEVDR